MILPRGREAGAFVELSLKPAALEAAGLPVFSYPIRQATLEQLMDRGGELDAETLILGLMDWLDVTEEPGRLMVAAPGPLTLATANSILNHAILRFMMEPYDSFLDVKNDRGRTGSFYSWEAGEVTACIWEYGLGWVEDRDRARGFDERYEELLRHDQWLAPNQIAGLIALAAGYGS